MSTITYVVPIRSFRSHPRRGSLLFRLALAALACLGLLMLALPGGAGATTGVDWFPQAGGSAAIRVTAGDGQFVAVGATGSIKTSPDGVTWTARTSGTTRGIRSVAYGTVAGAGRWVAATGPSYSCPSLPPPSACSDFLSSTDGGVTWTTTAIASGDIQDITYAEGLFVSSGNSAGGPASR